MSKNYISASQITQWLFCPVGYRLSYLERTEKPKPNIYMVWGSAMHNSLEANYTQKITTKKDLCLEELYQVFKDTFSKEDCIIPPFANANTMLMTAENVLAEYLKQVAPFIQPKYVEKEFTLQLKKYPITIHGYIDLITENDIIKDYKTVGKTALKEWTQYKADDSIQLTFYVAAFRKMFLKREAGIEVELIPRDSKPKFVTRSTKRTDEQVDYVLHLASVIQDLKDKGIFPANIHNCRECGYRDICPRK